MATGRKFSIGAEPLRRRSPSSSRQPRKPRRGPRADPRDGEPRALRPGGAGNVQPRPPSRPTSALPALTGARFFAAGSVVAFHYGRGSLGAIAPWLGRSAALGPAAVSFFYVLSGAVLTWGCTGPEGLPSRPARTFWAQRAARILPAYFLALAMTPEGNFGKGRFLMRTAVPKLLAEL